MKAFVLFIFVQTVVFISFTHSQNPIIKQFTLENGLSVILNEDHSKPEIFGVVVVKVGSKNDPADATGMAHYQEHMLFKGTEELGTLDWESEKPHINKIFELYDLLGKTSDENERKKIQSKINEESLQANEFTVPNEFSNLIKSTGGTNLNANTGYDRTVYFNAFPSNQIEQWLELNSHRLLNPVFRGFQSELEVVYEEKNLYSDAFQFALIESFNQNFFKKHPYGQQSVIGTIDHLKNPSLTKMYDFFKTYYVANNMALVLSGDFNTDEILPIIKDKFGRIKSGKIPEFKAYKEEPFKGREFVEKRLTPIKIGMLGFRTPPNGSDDELALDVCNGILSNQNETGLFDKLSLENKLLATMVIPMNNNDYSASIIFIIPKIIGQKLEAAEKLILTELEKLRKGDFDESLVNAVKYQLYKEFQMNMESTEKKAIMLSEAFSQNRNLDDFLNYSEKIKKISKEDVVRIANKYYGTDYLAFFSKMGFPKKEKINKPGYKPVLSNKETKSEYAKKLEEIPAKKPEFKFIDFKNDIVSTSIQKGVNLYFVKNPINDIYTLDFKFGVGTQKIPVLKQVAEILNFAGTNTKKVSDLKIAFANLGCSYSISCDESYFTISLIGIEENMQKSVELLNELISSASIEKDKINILVQAESTNRRMERTEPDNISAALLEYVKYGKNSDYIHRLSLKEISKLNTETLIAYFKKVLTFSCEIHYVGKNDPTKVAEIIKANCKFAEPISQSTSPEVLDENIITENTIFFVKNKKAVQSKVYISLNGFPFTPKTRPITDAFNLYFGGDFSGLVLQEIREYRSLAYRAGAGFSFPARINKQTTFTGFVGTQSDKTIEAMQVFSDLIHNMPEKKERINMIKKYLTLSAITNRPDFRELSETISKWKQMGYEEDPMKMKLEFYKNLTFDDIIDFYKRNMQSKPIAYSIVGNNKRINMKELEKFGKIKFIKEKNLFN